ncbi:MAG: hypothetical protein LH628_17405 [Microcoleus sp. CAN_BIN18]|nr:hypothetical protein [Microcoleus sp. CAN_BIN18]
MILSFKDIQFIIEALDFRIEAYQERLKDEELDDDEVSDMGNYCYFLEALCEDLMKAIKEGNMPEIAKPVPSDGLYQEVRN